MYIYLHIQRYNLLSLYKVTYKPAFRTYHMEKLLGVLFPSEDDISHSLHSLVASDFF